MKKKFVFIFLALALIPILASCTYIRSLMNLAANKKEYPNKPITVNYYVDEEIYKTETTNKRKEFTYPANPSKDELNFGGWTYKESYQTLDPEDFLYDDVDSIDLYAYFSKGTHFSDNLAYNGPQISKGVLPSFGSPKVLVVPVDLGGQTTSAMIDNIEKAFSGDPEELGYESVTSYYQKSSKGKLNLSFEVADTWFRPSKNASYYKDYNASTDKYNEAGSGLILHEFLEENNSKYDFSDYDYDGDGYIDSVWMIYNVPQNYDNTVFYWAYVTMTLNNSKKYDNVYARYYGFASYYFMFEKEYETPQRQLELYDMTNINIDAHTYIHETGHLLGLDDYYDSDASKGPAGGIYTAGMMDANRGDLSSIDKLLLGWIDPYVIYTNSNKTITINSFASSNDVILVSRVKPSSIYSEYFLIDLYNTEGFVSQDNEIEEPSDIVKADAMIHGKTYRNYGLRILHIDASLTNVYEGQTYDEPVKFAYNNSNTKKLFVDTVLNNSSYATQKINDINKRLMNYFGLYSLTGNYTLNYKMTNNTNIFFGITINSISKDSATITFNYN